MFASSRPWFDITMDLTAILAAVPTAAVITIATNWIIRRLDRPQAVFFAETLGFAIKAVPTTQIEVLLRTDPPSKSLSLTNSGDAPAYLLHVQNPGFRSAFLIGDETDPRQMRMSDTITSLAPGETANLLMWSSEALRASVKLTWLRAPVRHHRFEQQVIQADRPRDTARPRHLGRNYRPEVGPGPDET